MAIQPHFWLCNLLWPNSLRGLISLLILWHAMTENSPFWAVVKKELTLFRPFCQSSFILSCRKKSFVSKLQTNRPCNASFRSSCLQALFYFARHLRTLSPICITELQAFRPCSALLWSSCVQALLWAAGKRNSCTTEGTDWWTQPLWRGWSTTLCHTSRGQLSGQAFSAASK